MPNNRLRKEGKVSGQPTTPQSGGNPKPILTFEPLLSDVEAAELLGLHPKTLQRMARQGDIPAIRVGRYWRFRASELDEWIRLQSTGQPDCVETERTR